MSLNVERAELVEVDGRPGLRLVIDGAVAWVYEPKRSLLDLNAQIESLRADLAKLRGQDEQQVQSGKDLAREIAELQRKLKDQFAAIDERMRRLEPQRVSLDGRDAVVEAPEKKAYDEAIGILRKGEFANAAAAHQVREASAAQQHELAELYGRAGLSDEKAAALASWSAKRELNDPYDLTAQEASQLIAYLAKRIAEEARKAAQNTPATEPAPEEAPDHAA